MALVVVAVGN